MIIFILKLRVGIMKKALIVYWSKTENTKKVATAIEKGLEEAGLQVEMKEQYEAEDVDFFEYDLVLRRCSRIFVASARTDG